jgi:ppGpp synthetase/RelA/SpoT-type nucleotidyltranferase
VPERLNGHDWKSCVGFTVHRGFESLPLRCCRRRSNRYNLTVADPLSTAQLERLGKRLIATTPPSDADLQVLHELLEARSELLEEAIGRVKDELALDLTSRVKNTGTILEKLRRQGGWTLGSMQDVAGMRIVGDFDRRGQDVVVDDLVRVFSDAERAPKVIDRRTKPMHGYRAAILDVVETAQTEGLAPPEVMVAVRKIMVRLRQNVDRLASRVQSPDTL